MSNILNGMLNWSTDWAELYMQAKYFPSVRNSTFSTHRQPAEGREQEPQISWWWSGVKKEVTVIQWKRLPDSTPVED